MKSNVTQKFLLIAGTLILFSAHFSFSQSVRTNDLIIKRDSSRMQVQILEVEGQIIRYKKYFDKDGPTLSIEKAEIASIIYGNGEVENLQNTINSRFFYDSLRLKSVSTDQLKLDFKTCVKKAGNYNVMNVLGVTFGVLSTGAGIILTSKAVRDANDFSTSFNYVPNSVAKQMTAGIMLISTGVAAGIPLTVIGFNKKKHYTKQAQLIKNEVKRRKQIEPSI